MESSCQVGGIGKTILFLIFALNKISSSPCFRGKKRSAGEGSNQAAKRFASTCATSSDNQIDLDTLGPIDVKVGKVPEDDPMCFQRTKVFFYIGG